MSETIRPQPSLNRGRFRYAAWAGVLALVVTGGAAAPPPTPAEPSPMDEPIRLLSEARKTFQGVRDYTCLFIKREKLGGHLQPENQIAMKVRTQPFSVHLKWLSPKAQVGQEACYVAGKNRGMMRVRSPGLLGAVGWVSIEPTDPRVQQNSRHSITEAGIGNLIERFTTGWEQERRHGLTQVRVGEFEFNKRRCTRVETIHPPTGHGEKFTSYRNVLYFDKETTLPVRIEVYDWPRGGTEGELIEVYSYINLRTNVGLGDESFNY